MSFTDYYTEKKGNDKKKKEKDKKKDKKKDNKSIPIDLPTPDDELAHFENFDDLAMFTNEDYFFEGELEETLKKKIVIRGGQKVIKWKTNRPGYRVVPDDSGKPKEKRMDPAEIRKRAKGQRRGAIKRKAKGAQSRIKRKISLKKRGSFGLKR